MNPRLRRLQADFDHVREVYSGHSNVKVEPASNRFPPEIYRVDFNLKGLVLVGERPGNLDFEAVEVAESTEHVVEIMLPRLYPAEKPYVVPKSPIFHPNVQDYYCLVDDEYWAASTRLVDLIAKIGDMIQYRTYNLASPLDGLAAHWARDQESRGRFPVGDVDLGVADLSLDVKSQSVGDTRTESEDESGRSEVSFADQPADTEEEVVVKVRHE